MKYKIEKNTVQETLILPLYSRKLCTELYPNLYQDETAVHAKSELSPWDSRLQVSSRGYMLGYNDLKDPSVSGFFRFLARVGDNGMKMQIVKIGFGGRA